MRKLLWGTVLVVLAGVLGCSGSDPTPNTVPLTEEQKRQIKEQDQRIDHEERSAGGTASPRKKK